ncbi:chorismate mutase [Streptomyces turgidiscabies]|uniref:chorismate mutase n=1 Tax=Streptomyces turgidiscabies (strain Car8) TaxID=698760 RepID=L7F8Z1_STRT8|nr:MULTISPECIES: chorismate mutase [Streptomyces]ELP67130.1 putative chorismate mutase [Streptomyces turgidiscabies Car8]MDX3497622.1 chorismate mutase [Streptomyces turgidiscabies]GAQ76084.1 secreted chorismate mutase precursor [Streptomyces turgidiscabies]
MRSVLLAVCASAVLAVSGAAPAVAQTSTPVRVSSVALSPASPASSLTSLTSLTPLTDLFAERLLVADKVAAAKYGTDKPIDDPVREQQILDDVSARAVGLGLDPAAVAAVFRDQIEANKVVQRGLYRRWDAHPELRPTERPDLVKEVRPILDRITTELLDALKETQGVRAGGACEPRLWLAAGRSAFGYRLDGLHLEGLGRAVPSVCG